MKQNSSFFNEIIIRRIPQIIGMYIAAVWLAVEIADWMSERFGVSNLFSSYVFVGMLTILPSVILLAWGHGRPGKDRWAKKEIIWLPLNIVLAFFVIKQVVTTEPENKTVESKDIPVKSAVVDPIAFEESKVNVFQEIKKPANHQKVISFFWDNQSNDESLQWLQYGAPWLVSQDLKRTPVLSVNTPYDSAEVLSDIVSKGFDDALNIPLALALQIANSQSAKWMILGSIEKAGSNILFTAKIIDVITGDEIESISESNDNLLTSLNSISKRISFILHEFVPKPKNIIPDLAIQEHTSTNLNAIKYLITAQNDVAFDNDYSSGIENLNKALIEDAQFAEANVLAANYYRALGDIPQAIKQSKQALMLDYKVYQESVYEIKAQLFGMTGNENKAMQVLENWVKVFPESAMGLTTLGRNYLVLNQLDNAKGVYEKLANLDSSDDDSLLNLGRINRLQDNQQEALAILQQYLENNPEKAEAYIELGDAYRQFMMLQKAKEMYEQASIIGSNDFEAEIGLAYVTAFEGDYSAAIKQLQDLLLLSQSQMQRFNIQNTIKNLYIQTGQIKKAYDILESQRETAHEVLNPLNYTFTMGGGEIELLVLIGKYQEALELVEKLEQETKPPFNKIASAFHLTIYQEMGNKELYEKKLSDFELFLQEFPISFYENLIFAWKANVASWHQNYELADQYYNQAYEYSKKSFVRLQTLEVVDMISYSKAESLYQRNLLEETILELDLILKHNPLFANAHYLKAKCYFELGNRIKAENEIAKAREIWKNSDEEFIGRVELLQLETENKEL